MSLSIVKIENPFDRTKRIVDNCPHTGENLSSIIKQRIPDDVGVMVSVNGGIVPKDKWDDFCPADGEMVLMVPVIEGGDDKGIFNMVAVLAVTVAAFAFGQYYMGWEAIAVFAFTASVGMAGGLLMNTLNPPPTEALPGVFDQERSQMYGWEPQTTQRQGLPIGMFYGKNKLYGNIISANSESTPENDGQILNLLIDLGYGPFKSLSDIQINKQPITNFTDVNHRIRHGLLDQSVISNFDTIKIEYAVNHKVPFDTPYTYETETGTFDALEVDIGFPGGLYKVNSGGAFVDHSVNIKIEYQYVGEGSWHELRTGAKKEIQKLWFVHPYNPYPSDYNVPAVTDYPWIKVVGHDLTTDDRVLVSGVVGMIELNKNVYDIKDRYGNNWIQLDVDASGFTAYESSGEIQSDSAHITDYRSGNIKRTYKIDDVVADNIYNIKVTKLSEDEVVKRTGEPNARFGDDVYLSTVRAVTNQALEYPRHVLNGIKALATDQLSGSIGYSCIAECRFIRTYDGTNWGVEYSTNPAWVLFDILTQPVYSGTTPYEPTASPPSSVTAISDNTDISVDTDTFTCSDSGSSFASYTVGEWVLAEGFDDAANNGYFEVTASDANSLTVDGELTIEEEGATVSITQDPFVIERYDGRNPLKIDIAKFKELADFCNTLVGPSGNTSKRITFNGGFDQGTSVWKAVLKVCEVARCVPVLIGNQISLAIDTSADTPVQVFNVGNIKKDSYKKSFLSLEDRASEIEIQYRDEDEDYERVPLTVVNPSLDISENSVSIELFGITNATEAWRAGLYRLRKNQYILRTLSFEADVDAIGAAIGDMIAVQHDVPNWGEGGRVVSATATTITLDKAITEVGSDYVFIRYSDDSFETISVTSVNSAGTEITASFSPPIYSEGTVDVEIGYATVTGTGTVFTIGVKPDDLFSLGGSGDPSYTVLSVTDDTHLELTTNYAESTDSDLDYEIQTLPHKDDLWIYGTQTNVQKFFKVVNLEKSQDQYVTISCVEYNENVYEDDSEAIIPTPPTITTIDYKVANLALKEIVSLSDSGVINRQIEVTYDIPRNYVWQKAVIYYRIASLTNWNKAGETTSNSFLIPNILTTTTYEILVVSVDLAGRYTDFASSPSEQITTGSNADYDGIFLNVKVTGLELEGEGNGVEFTGKDAKFVWHDVKIVSEIEYGAGEEPGGAGNTSANHWLKDYEVEIYDGDSNKRRIIHVKEPRYTYAYEQNVEDGTGTPVREIEIQVRARDIYYRISEVPAKITVSNPAPDAPANGAVTEYQQALDVTWDAVTDLDLMGYKVYVSTSGSFTPGSANLVYTGLSTRYIHQSTSYVAHYVRIAAYDAFGTTGLNYTAELSGTPDSPTTGELTDYDLDVPLTSGLVFATTDAGCTWTTGTMVYGGQSVTITAGAVATTDMYIYADLSGDSAGNLADPLTLSHSDVKPVIGQDKWLFAVVEYNAADDPDYTVFPAFGQRIIHAGLLQADTITADLIGAGEIQAGHLFAGSIDATDLFVGGIVNGAALDTNYAGGASQGGAANSITEQGALATKGSVDLGTDEVTNKSLANLDDTANTKLNGIETGADVTGDNIPTNVQTGADRANTGLNATSELVTAIICDNTLTMEDREAGLYLDKTTMGYWDGITWQSYIDNSGNALFAKSLTIGTLASSEGVQILVDASGVGSLKAQYIYGGYYYTNLISAGGYQSFYKFGAFATTTVATDRIAKVGGTGTYNLFSAICAGPVSGTSPAYSCASTTKTGYYFFITFDEGRFGASGDATAITYNSTGVVDVPAAAVSGILDGVTLKDCDVSGSLTLDVMTTAEINAISSPATGTLVFNSTLSMTCIKASDQWERIHNNLAM